MSRAAGRPAPLALRPPEWMDRALCAQLAPDAWFPEGGPATSARRVCAACPVRAECLAYALGNGERFGIWGGLAYDERRAVARTRKQLGAAA
jgi:WhiB family redox-sensing transcriptional regulator